MPRHHFFFGSQCTCSRYCRRLQAVVVGCGLLPRTAHSCGRFRLRTVAGDCGHQKRISIHEADENRRAGDKWFMRAFVQAVWYDCNVSCTPSDKKTSLQNKLQKSVIFSFCILSREKNTGKNPTPCPGVWIKNKQTNNSDNSNSDLKGPSPKLKVTFDKMKKLGNDHEFMYIKRVPKLPTTMC